MPNDPLELLLKHLRANEGAPSTDRLEGAAHLHFTTGAASESQKELLRAQQEFERALASIHSTSPFSSAPCAKLGSAQAGRTA